MLNKIILYTVNNTISLTLNYEQALNKLHQAINQHQVNTALSYAQQITTQAPHFLPAYTALYKILTFLQNFSALETAAKTATEFNPKHALSYHALAQAYRFQRKADLATKALAKAVELSPNNIEWRNNLAIMHKEQGHFTQALSGFEMCISQAPHFTPAYWHRSDIIPFLPKKYLETLVNLLTSEECIDNKKQVYAAYALFKHFDTIKDFH